MESQYLLTWRVLIKFAASYAPLFENPPAIWSDLEDWIARQGFTLAVRRANAIALRFGPLPAADWVALRDERQAIARHNITVERGDNDVA